MIRSPSVPIAALLLAGLALAAPAAAGPGNCMWEPGFANTVYTASGGTLHLHDGTICTAHPHVGDPVGHHAGCAAPYALATGGNAAAYPGNALAYGPFNAADMLVVEQWADTLAYTSCAAALP